MKTIATIAAAILCSFFQPAQAGTVGLHTLSYHTDTAGNWNNVNLGAYYRTDSGYQFGAYYNSLKRPTVYAAKVFESGRFGLAVGVATGYSNAQPIKGVPLTPIIAPTVKLTEHVRLLAMPTYRKEPKQSAVYGAVLHITYEF